MDHKRAGEVAANRLQIISPILDRTLDKAKKQDLKEAAGIQYGVSERTIRRWINSYTEIVSMGSSRKSLRLQGRAGSLKTS